MAGQKRILVAQDEARGYLTSPVITVIVGPNDQDSEKPCSQTFFVHKDLITSRSCFFAKALKDYTGSKSVEDDGGVSWLEGKEGVVRMPEDEPEVFANYVQLLYHGVIPIYDELEQAVASNTLAKGITSEQKSAEHLKQAVASAAQQEYNTLAKIYVLCEKIQDTATKRLVFAAFIEATTKKRVDTRRHYLDSRAIRFIYAGTLASDPLRTFVADCYVLVGNSSWMESADFYPHEFLYDVTLGMLKERAVSDAKAELRLEDKEACLKKLDVFEQQDANDGNI